MAKKKGRELLGTCADIGNVPQPSANERKGVEVTGPLPPQKSNEADNAALATSLGRTKEAPLPEPVKTNVPAPAVKALDPEIPAAPLPKPKTAKAPKARNAGKNKGKAATNGSSPAFWHILRTR